jgi:hypothetical protein
MAHNPTSFSCHYVNHNRIDSSWTNSDAYDGLDIYRNGAHLANLDPSDTSYHDTSCAAGTAYTYYVRATLGGTGYNSGSDSDTTPVDALSALSCGSATETTIPLTWMRGETYDSISIEYKDTTSSYAVWGTATGSANSKTATGLSQGTTYSFRTRGKIGSTWSSYSNSDSASTDLTEPSSPHIAGLTATTVRFSWTNNATYSHVEVHRKESGGSYSIVKTADGSVTYYDDTVNPDIRYYYKVRAKVDVNSGYTSEVNILLATASATGTIGFDGSYVASTVNGILATGSFGMSFLTTSTVAWNAHVSVTGTLGFDGSWESTVVTIANYGYFLGDNTGKVYYFDDAYKSDNGESIVCYWKTKDLDFTDSDQEAISRFKTIYTVKVIYRDLSANTPINLYVSTNGGTTWTAYTRTVGSGDETAKYAMFYMIQHGERFVFKIECASTSVDFQLTGLEVEYEPAGEYAEAS